MHQVTHRPEEDASVIVVVFWPRLEQQMHMVRHHAGSEQIVALAVKMTQGIQHDRSGFG